MSRKNNNNNVEITVNNVEVTKAIKNKVFTKNRINSILSVNSLQDKGYTVDTVDTIFQGYTNKSQLNTMTKDTKCNITVFYLLTQYLDTVNTKYNEDIRHFKAINGYSKEDKKFYSPDYTDEHLQLELLNMQNEKTSLINNINSQIDIITGSLNVENLYSFYCEYVRNVFTDNIYKDVFKVVFSSWLVVNKVLPTHDIVEPVIELLGSKYNTKVLNNNRIIIPVSKKDFVKKFVACICQALIDKNVINTESFIGNRKFLASLKGLECEKSVEFLQEVYNNDIDTSK